MICCLIVFNFIQNFPAIVLDKEFLGEQYAETLESIKDYMKELTREQLKHGGVNVHYYSWTRINLKNGSVNKLYLIQNV